MRTRVLIVSQDQGISPYSLQAHPTPFDDLIRDTEGAELADVGPEWHIPLGRLYIRANPETGLAEVWKMRLDSSD